MSKNAYAMILVAVMAFSVMLCRFLPFVLFDKKESEPPAFIRFLGRYLPMATIGMLVVYCLRNVSVTAYPHGLPELIAVIAVGLIQWWKENTILSILLGTLCYILLIQAVF